MLFAFNYRNPKLQFKEHAKEILVSSQSQARNIFKTIRGMSTTITSFAIYNQKTWPFVTIPHYRQREKEVFDSSAASYIWFSPIVPQESRLAWEEWSANNQEWIVEEYGSQENNTLVDYFGRTITSIHPFIHNRNRSVDFEQWTVYRPEGPFEGSTEFAPIW